MNDDTRDPRGHWEYAGYRDGAQTFRLKDADNRDLPRRYGQAIADPGSILPRKDREAVSHWATRAVLAVRDEEVMELAGELADERTFHQETTQRAEAAERKLTEIADLVRHTDGVRRDDLVAHIRAILLDTGDQP